MADEKEKTVFKANVTLPNNKGKAVWDKDKFTSFKTARNTAHNNTLKEFTFDGTMWTVTYADMVIAELNKHVDKFDS